MIVDVLRNLDCEVVFDRRQGCCGAPVYLSGDFDTGRKMAAQKRRGLRGLRLRRHGLRHVQLRAERVSDLPGRDSRGKGTLRAVCGQSQGLQRVRHRRPGRRPRPARDQAPVPRQDRHLARPLPPCAASGHPRPAPEDPPVARRASVSSRCPTPTGAAGSAVRSASPTTTSPGRSPTTRSTRSRPAAPMPW